MSEEGDGACSRGTPWRRGPGRRKGGGPRHRHRPLRRQLFVLFGAAILVSMLASLLVGHLLLGPHEGWRGSGDRHGPRNHGERRRPRPSPALFVLSFVGTAGGLWLAAGIATARLVRPMEEAVRVAREIGAGRLDARMRLRWFGGDESRQLATALSDMATRIEAQLRGHRELLAAVSHELRTPLARLRLLVELSRTRGLSEEQAVAIEQELIELDELIDRLLSSSRLDFSELQRVEVDLVALTQDALRRHGRELSLLDAANVDGTVEGDPALLARAIANLLENAEKHAGGVTGVSLREDGDRLILRVRDEGPGIPEDQQEQVFEPFRRGTDGAAGKIPSGSLGLGLALVQRIAVAHGGSAWVERASGYRSGHAGTTVAFATHRGR